MAFLTSGFLAGAGPAVIFCSRRHNTLSPGDSREMQAKLPGHPFSRLVRDFFQRAFFGRAKRGGGEPPPRDVISYLTSTLAPASSSFFFAASESALLAPSSTGLGAPSTSALASAKPRPALTSRTALMTAIFLSAGTDARITSNVLLASAAGAAAAPGPPPG